ncbi:hypothetical protein BH09VER1_BH09VER1_05560 [soil metagenome]
MEFLTTLAGAFFGALAAFLSEALRRKFEEKNRQYESILATQATLISQANSIESVMRRISTQRDANPFDNLKYMLLRFSQQSIDFTKLTFIGASLEPNLLLKMDVAQEGFQFAVGLVEERNKLLDRFFNDPKTELKEFDSETGAVRATGDPRILNNLRQMNQTVYTAMQQTIKVNREARDSLYSFGKRQFPKSKLLFVANESPLNNSKITCPST